VSLYNITYFHSSFSLIIHFQKFQKKLYNGFQISDVISIVNDNKDSIQNSPELLSKLEGIGGAVGLVDGLKKMELVE
jgi:hypothetical protein